MQLILFHIAGVPHRVRVAWVTVLPGGFAIDDIAYAYAHICCLATSAQLWGVYYLVETATATTELNGRWHLQATQGPFFFTVALVKGKPTRDMAIDRIFLFLFTLHWRALG